MLVRIMIVLENKSCVLRQYELWRLFSSRILECGVGYNERRALSVIVVMYISRVASRSLGGETTVALSRDKHPDGRGRLPALYRSLSSSAQQIRKAPIDKVPVLQVQHQVSDRFEILLVESEEDPTSPQGIHYENLELSIRLQVTSSLTCLPSPL
ncbi:hypothetical protein Tco_1530631 [Tanacetum coccineum]